MTQIVRTNPRADIYRNVTDIIVRDLEQGTRPWIKPWTASSNSPNVALRPLRHDGTPYRGVNVLILWSAAAERGYHNYGGRGITVCERWQGPDGFKNFIKDIGPRPSRKYSIDRWPNNDTGNYEPNNVRGTRKQQADNRRNSVRSTPKDESS
jgi:hypothetical protein